MRPSKLHTSATVSTRAARRSLRLGGIAPARRATRYRQSLRMAIRRPTDASARRGNINGLSNVICREEEVVA